MKCSLLSLAITLLALSSHAQVQLNFNKRAELSPPLPQSVLNGQMSFRFSIPLNTSWFNDECKALIRDVIAARRQLQSNIILLNEKGGVYQGLLLEKDELEQIETAMRDWLCHYYQLFPDLFDVPFANAGCQQFTSSNYLPALPDTLMDELFSVVISYNGEKKTYNLKFDKAKEVFCADISGTVKNAKLEYELRFGKLRNVTYKKWAGNKMPEININRNYLSNLAEKLLSGVPEGIFEEEDENGDAQYFIVINKDTAVLNCDKIEQLEKVIKEKRDMAIRWDDNYYKKYFRHVIYNMLWTNDGVPVINPLGFYDEQTLTALPGSKDSLNRQNALIKAYRSTADSLLYKGVLYVGENNFMRHYNAIDDYKSMNEKRIETYDTAANIVVVVENKPLNTRVSVTSTTAVYNPRPAFSAELDPVLDLATSAASKVIAFLDSSAVGGGGAARSMDLSACDDEIKSINKAVKRLQETTFRIKWLALQTDVPNDLELAEAQTPRLATSAGEPIHIADSSRTVNYNVYAAVDSGDKKVMATGSFKVYKKTHWALASGFAYDLTGITSLTIDDKGAIQQQREKPGRIILGLKYFLRPVDVRPLAWPKRDEWYRLNLFLGVSVDKNPLDNVYGGVGFDLLPGLNFGIGAHLFKTSRLDIRNGAVVSQEDIRKFNPYISFTLDPITMLKIFNVIKF